MSIRQQAILEVWRTDVQNRDSSLIGTVVILVFARLSGRVGGQPPIRRDKFVAKFDRRTHSYFLAHLTDWCTP